MILYLTKNLIEGKVSIPNCTALKNVDCTTLKKTFSLCNIFDILYAIAIILWDILYEPFMFYVYSVFTLGLKTLKAFIESTIAGCPNKHEKGKNTFILSLHYAGSFPNQHYSKIIIERLGIN